MLSITIKLYLHQVFASVRDDCAKTNVTAKKILRQYGHELSTEELLRRLKPVVVRSVG